MKFRMKLNIFLMGLAALAVASCEDGPGIVQPSVEPQLPEFTDADVQVALSQGLNSSAINLQSAMASDAPVAIVDVTSVENLPEGAQLDFAIQISDDASFADYREVSGPVSAGNVAEASAVSFNSALKAIAGNVTVPTQVYYRIPGYVTISKGKYRLGSADKYYGEGQVTVTPVDNPVISSDPSAELASGAIDIQQMTDDGIEIIPLIDVTSISELPEGYKLSYKYVLSGNQDMSDAKAGDAGFESNVVSVSRDKFYETYKQVFGAGSEKNTVYWGVQAFYTYDGATYNVSGDDNCIKQGSVEVTPLAVPLHLGTPNTSQDWKPETSQWLVKVGTTDVYRGFSYFGGQYGGKFTDDFTGSTVWYGLDGDVVIDENGVVTGKISSSSGNNILEGSSPALYWMEVDMEALTFKMTPIESFGLIGSATPGGWDAETKLEASADMLKWTATVGLKDGDLKFRANNAWAISLGSSASDLQFDGGNLPSPGEGNYVVTLSLGKIPYTATYEAR